jgi:hypothetical protein
MCGARPLSLLCLHGVDKENFTFNLLTLGEGMKWNIAVGGRVEAWSSFVPTIRRILFSTLSTGAPYFTYQTQAV